MNEKIKQLADQARVLADEFQEQWKAGPSNEEFFQEKFAQLIVQECMQQVEEQYKPILEDETMMKDIRWAYYVDCGVDSYVAIREHFFGEEL